MHMADRPCRSQAAHKTCPAACVDVKQQEPPRTWAVAGGVRRRCLCDAGPLPLQLGSPSPRLGQNRRPAQQLCLLLIVPQHGAERRGRQARQKRRPLRALALPTNPPLSETAKAIKKSLTKCKDATAVNT